jgi:hypothetical protein
VGKVHAVAQLAEELRYKPEGRGFDSRFDHWNFFFIIRNSVVLESTHPLMEMSTRDISFGGGG